MKVLMISGDKNLLKTSAEARERLALQTSQVEQLDVVVWPQIHPLLHIFALARRNHYDVVTAQDPFWRGLLAWKIARLTGARLNLQVHADLRGQSRFRRLLATFLLQRANSIRVQSARLAEEVKIIGVKAPVTILPVYIDLARVTAAPRARHPYFAKTILWIGRFEREKDPLAAIRILQDVRAAGLDAGLIMLGSGSLEAELKRAAENLPIEFPGWREPAPYYAMADIVISTSPYESYGASIVEALAAGVPVVCRDVGVAREAGAVIASPEGSAAVVINLLKGGTKGELILTVYSREEWGRRWRDSL